jgi:hypothetical protein
MDVSFLQFLDCFLLCKRLQGASALGLRFWICKKKYLTPAKIQSVILTLKHLVICFRCKLLWFLLPLPQLLNAYFNSVANCYIHCFYDCLLCFLCFAKVKVIALA